MKQIAFFLIIIIGVRVTLAQTSVRDWENAGFQETTLRNLAPETDEAFKIPLTFLRDSSSSWTQAQLELLLRMTESLYFQCRVSFAPIQLVSATRSNLHRVSCQTDYTLTESLPTSTLKPVVIFPQNMLCLYGAAYANAPYWQDHDFEHLTEGTVFIGHNILLDPFIAEIPMNLATLVAHELLHIFVNGPHVRQAGNLLDGDLNTRGPYITPEQCGKVHEYIRRNKNN